MQSSEPMSPYGSPTTHNPPFNPYSPTSHNPYSPTSHHPFSPYQSPTPHQFPSYSSPIPHQFPNHQSVSPHQFSTHPSIPPHQFSTHPSTNPNPSFHPTTLHPSSPITKPRFQDNTPRLLPSYLLGNNQSRSGSFKNPPPTHATTTPTQSPTYLPTNYPSSYERPRNHHTGPPLQSLEEAYTANRRSNALNNYKNLDTTNSPGDYLIHQNDSFMSSMATSNDSKFSVLDNSCTTLEHCWITVFGFPNNATSAILQEFSELGNVLQHIIPQSGNWIHLEYENKIQTRRALSRNGRVMGSCVKLGVESCTDQTVMKTATPKHTLNHTHPHNLSNAQSLDRALNGEPKKMSAGFLSKAIDYVFRW